MTGVQRYAYEIVRGLDGLLGGGHVLGRNLRVELLLPPDATPPADLQHIGIRTLGRSGGHIWEQTVLPSAAKGHLLSLCNTGPVTTRRQIVCIHDANTRICPQSYSLPFRSLYRVLLPVLGRSARQIATVSSYSSEALVRYGICKPEKLAVIPNGHEHATRWTPRHSATTRGAAGPETIVLIGSSVPHKNARLLLGMAERLADAGMRIAVVGARDARVFGGAEPIRSPDTVAWLGRLSDAEFAALLGDCLCLAFPLLCGRLRPSAARGDGARLSGCRIRPYQHAGGVRRCSTLRGTRQPRRLVRELHAVARDAGPSCRADPPRPSALDTLPLARFRRALPAPHGLYSTE